MRIEVHQQSGELEPLWRKVWFPHVAITVVSALFPLRSRLDAEHSEKNEKERAKHQKHRLSDRVLKQRSLSRVDLRMHDGPSMGW